VNEDKTETAVEAEDVTPRIAKGGNFGRRRWYELQRICGGRSRSMRPAIGSLPGRLMWRLAITYEISAEEVTSRVILKRSLDEQSFWLR
jgi:hypothetical protein